MFLRKRQLVEVSVSPTLKDRGDVAILLIIGGGRIGGLTEWLASQYDVVVIADVRNVLNGYRTRFRKLTNIIYYAVGEGQTAASLFATASPELQAAVNRLAPLNAEDGMGSLAGIGFQGFATGLRTPEHARLMQHIVDQAVIATKGAPARIRGRTCISEAGGTGAAAPVLFTRSFIEALSILEIPIDWEYECVGSVTYTGLARRAPLNAASAQWRILRDLVRNRPQDAPLVVESLRLIEFQPFGHDHKARLQSVAIDEQSASARELRLHLNLIRPNLAMDGPFGLASSWKMDRSEFLSPDKEVIPYVAPLLLLQVRNAIADASPVPSMVSDISVRATETLLERESIDELIANPGDVEETVAKIRRPGKTRGLNLVAVMSNGHEFDLNRVEADFQQTPDTLTDFSRSLLELSSMSATLNNELSVTRQDIELLEAEISEDEHQLTAALTNYWYGGSRWRRSRRKLEDRCFALAEHLRQLSDQLIEQQELRDAQAIACGKVVREEEFYKSTLEKIADCLDGHVPRGQIRADDFSTVVVQDADAVFDGLLTLPELSKSEQREFLAKCVAAVTLEGLAKILDVPNPRMDVIAETIVNEELAVQGPPHGAKVQRREGINVVVLPTLPDNVRNDLMGQVARRAPDLIVAMADSAAAGIAIVRYTVFSSDSLRELFPGRMWADLRRAYESEQRLLYFPDGTDGLAEDLGVA